MESPDIRGGSDAATTLETAEKIILRWDSTTSEEAKENLIFQSDRDEVDRYLQAVDEVQRLVSSVSISDSHHHHEVKARSTIQIAMARLEDELRNILLSQTSTFEPDSLLLDSSASAFATRADLEDNTETVGADEGGRGAGTGGNESGSTGRFRFKFRFRPRFEPVIEPKKQLQIHKQYTRDRSRLPGSSFRSEIDRPPHDRRRILPRVPTGVRERAQIRHGDDLQAAGDSEARDR